MCRRDRLLQAGCLCLVALHGVGCFLWPGKMWGLSHLAVWPRGLALSWTALAAVALLLLPRFVRRAPLWGYPGRRGSALLALLAALPFGLLRERTHFFGDGYLLIRDRALSETVSRAPVLVRCVGFVVRDVGARLGWGAEQAFAALAVAAGVLAVYLLLRLAARLGGDRETRFAAAAVLLGAGALQLFCGHVEYYPTLAVGVLAYLYVGCLAVQEKRRLWPTWLVYGALLPLHLSSLGLAPAQAYVGWLGWRRGERRATVLAAVGAVALAAALSAVAGRPAQALAETTAGGLWRYIGPYLDRTSPRHAFGFLAPGHLLALANDLLLTSPLAAAALPALLARRARDTTGRFLGLGALGCLGLDVAFNRELGPYRDWDILAPYAFVYLAWTAAALVRPGAGAMRIPVLLALVTGVYHLAPWVALNTSPRAAFAHLQLVLGEPSQWSPAARGYMQEEIAIYLRNRGDVPGATRAYEAAVRANPADARYHVGLGNLYFEAGNLPRAEAEFGAALVHRPDYAPAHNNLAFVLLREGHDLESARQHVERALQLSPHHPDYLTTLGELELRGGRMPAARAALEEALHVRPRSPDAARLLDEVRRTAAAESRRGPR